VAKEVNVCFLCASLLYPLNDTSKIDGPDLAKRNYQLHAIQLGQYEYTETKHVAREVKTQSHFYEFRLY
jgi:hypothetical protein